MVSTIVCPTNPPVVNLFLGIMYLEESVTEQSGLNVVTDWILAVQRETVEILHMPHLCPCVLKVSLLKSI